MSINNVLMKNGVALWLVKHSKLSYNQIATFCNLHPLEVEILKNNNKHIQECNPILALFLSEEEILRCEKDYSLSLKMQKSSEYSKQRKTKDINLYNGILWMLKNTSLESRKIAKLLKCTKVLVESISDQSFKDYAELRAINPVTLALCSAQDLDSLIYAEQINAQDKK